MNLLRTGILVRNRHGARMSGSELSRSHGAPAGTLVSHLAYASPFGLVLP
jgi:hypothetical protein